MSTGRVKSFFLTIAGLAAVGAVGLYFALQPALGLSRPTPGMVKKVARTQVLNALREQIRTRLAAQAGRLDAAAEDKMVESQMASLLKSNEPQIRETVERMSEKFDMSARVRSRRYLTGADEYYYLYQTQNIYDTGRVSDRIKAGQYFDAFRLAPRGDWSWLNLHPYLGSYWARALIYFNPGMDVMEAACFFSLVLLMLIVALFFGLAASMKMRRAAAVLGCLALVLAPMFLQRGSFGTYDTDMYNILFPMIILISFFSSFGRPAKAAVHGALGGLLTGLYGLFWNGWPYIFVMMTGAVFVLFLAGCLFRNGSWRFLISYAACYALGSLASASLLLGPFNVYHSFLAFLTVVPSFAGKAGLLVAWPDPFLGIGEAAHTPWKKVFFLGFGSNVMVGLAAAGLLWGTVYGIWKRDFLRFSQAVLITVFLFPVMMAHNTERFTLLVLLPAALAVMLGGEALFWLAEIRQAIVDSLRGKLRSIAFRMQSRPVFETVFRAISVVAAVFARPVMWGAKPLRKIPAGVFVGLAFAAFIAQPLLIAQIVTGRARPIMNDTWYEVLNEIRTKTPDNAIVNTWWPPGYFVMALARRAVTTDGGSQQRPATYWMSRILMSDNEYEAAGILRMLNTSNNDALQFLEKLRIDSLQAMRVILNVVPVAREDAAGLILARMPADKRGRLLDATHGSGPAAPGYVMVYDDLITNTVSVNVMAKWDFRKARESQAGQKPKEPAGAGRPADRGDHVREQIDLSGGILKYTQESALEKREGDTLFFANGLKIDLASMTARVKVSGKEYDGQPMSLFYMDSGRLVENRNFGALIDASALLIKQGGTYTALLAHRDLIRSVMYRMFYLNGEGLRFFRSFLRKEGPSGEARPTRILVFEFDQAAFEAALKRSDFAAQKENKP